jgi:hypothetical protein
MANQLIAPLGLIAKYYGQAGGSTSYYYWVQAIYPDGTSPLSAVASVVNAQSALSALNQVQLTWQPVPGAIGYNLFGSSTNTLPTTGNILVAQLGPETGWSDKGAAYLSATVKYNPVYTARARYNFAVDGGAISTLTPSDSDIIPANAVVFGGFVNSTVAPVGASATVAIGTSAGSSSTSIMAATAITSLTIDAVLPLLGFNPLAVTQKALFKMTAAGSINITIATTPLTAGVLEIFIQYMLPTAP